MRTYLNGNVEGEGGVIEAGRRRQEATACDDDVYVDPKKKQKWKRRGSGREAREGEARHDHCFLVNKNKNNKKKKKKKKRKKKNKEEEEEEEEDWGIGEQAPFHPFLYKQLFSEFLDRSPSSFAKTVFEISISQIDAIFCLEFSIFCLDALWRMKPKPKKPTRSLRSQNVVTWRPTFESLQEE